MSWRHIATSRSFVSSRSSFAFVRGLATQSTEQPAPTHNSSHSPEPSSQSNSSSSSPAPSSLKEDHSDEEKRASPLPSLARLSPAPRSTSASDTDGSRPLAYRSNLTFNPEHSFETVIPRLPQRFGANQRLTVPDETRALLEEIVGTFRAPIRYAFAYGSGVFKQIGYESSGENPMLDFIFAVSHPDHWHALNMEQNPSHYPLSARLARASLVSRFQNISPGLWFNAYVPVNGAVIKYGVTSIENLTSDLLMWKTLYLAGRMHKPIRIIKDDPRIRLTQQVNLASALRTALVILPPEFTERQLFEAIAGFSYAGDPRMSLPAENRDKVHNIVQAQSAQFRELYRRLASGMPGVYWPEGKRVLEQDYDARTRVVHLRRLPLTLLKGVERYYMGRSPEMATLKEGDETAFWQRIAGDDQLGDVIQRELKDIVRGPATVQSFKGLVTSGVLKSVRYSTRKVGKWWKG